MVELCYAFQECRAWGGSENSGSPPLDHDAVELQLLPGNHDQWTSLAPSLSFSYRLYPSASQI